MTANLVVMAIDPGLTTGWSVSGAGKGEVKHRKVGAPGTEQHRSVARSFSAWLADMLFKHKPDVLVIERPYFNPRQVNAAILLYGLRMLALSIVADARVVEVEPCKWQRYAAQHGWKKSKLKGNHASDAHWMRLWYEMAAP